MKTVLKLDGSWLRCHRIASKVYMLNFYCKQSQAFRTLHHKQIADWDQICQSELMVEIYSKSLFRAIGKVLYMEFS